MVGTMSAFRMFPVFDWSVFGSPLYFKKSGSSLKLCRKSLWLMTSPKEGAIFSCSILPWCAAVQQKYRQLWLTCRFANLSEYSLVCAYLFAWCYVLMMGPYLGWIIRTTYGNIQLTLSIAGPALLPKFALPVKCISGFNYNWRLILTISIKNPSHFLSFIYYKELHKTDL